VLLFPTFLRLVAVAVDTEPMTTALAGRAAALVEVVAVDSTQELRVGRLSAHKGTVGEMQMGHRKQEVVVASVPLALARMVVLV